MKPPKQGSGVVRCPLFKKHSACCRECLWGGAGDQLGSSETGKEREAWAITEEVEMVKSRWISNA